MAYNYEYPYFDTGNFNSDWLINKMKELEETVIGLETFKYVGENEILDLNQQKQNSIAAFTSNFNVLNSPVSNVQRVTVTYGSETAYIQQLYDLSKYTVYTRNYSTATGWTAWKLTQNAPGTVIVTDEVMSTGDFNSLPDNKALLLRTDGMLNAPINGYGYLLTWKPTNDNAKLQVFFSNSNKFIYIRNFTGTNWSPWVEANHIDLTNYLKGISTITTDNLNNLYKNVTALVRGNSTAPNTGTGYILSLKGSDSVGVMQIWFDITQEIWLRYFNGTSWQEWVNLTRNEKVLHRHRDTSNANDIVAGRFYSGHITTPINEYIYIQGVGKKAPNTDQYQIILTADNTLCSRFRNNASWGALARYQKVSSTRSITITSTAKEHSTDDEGAERYMMGDNIYTEAANTMYNTYISLPGQSLLHSDEGKQSFKDAILAADLSDTDVVMTNLEMWDMDIPLDTIVEEVQSLAEAVTAKNPMCELTLLSIPPVDIPLWGDELLDYTMPNGSNIRQLDDRLFRLTEDNAFKYVSFEYFYDSQNANLLEYLGDDFKTNKQYLRRVGSFIKNVM